ncbi:hypothetical protein M433DRAFT_154017 [Acidomyces richmondensis BFW]|nr:MAG: hypothetical protein FE78DRAFT_89891 [Acidomyces sp. 'richmondensis']KYG45885.1 hypothetical protein M433DRAFT_154017 [Acidomyces richmondensis BFW]
MGWFWGSSKVSQPGDAYSNLDPALRDFLDKESPLKYEEAKRSQQKAEVHEPDTHRGQAGYDASSPQQGSINRTSSSAVPSESLFPDGRYAHLWKTYKPLAEIDAVGKSDQDKLRDVVDAYNSRKAALGRAAVENCVVEQMAERDCWQNGTMWDRMNLCRGRNRAFIRCYTMQSRFLKALGYLSITGSEEEDERIQMHADKLYHEMLDREEAAEKARTHGEEAAKMPSLISPENTLAALGKDSAWAKARQRALELGEGAGLKLSDFSPEKQEAIKKRIEGMNELEKELELQLIAAETRATREYAEKVHEMFEEERRHRLDRRARGKETVGDTLKRLWGWDKDG